MTYALPYLQLYNAEKLKIEGLIRQAYKAALGLPINTSTNKLLQLGLHNTLDELTEAHRRMQELRLARTNAGRAVLRRLGINAAPLNAGTRKIPSNVRKTITVKPLPKNMHPAHHEGRRRARAQALAKKFEGRTDVVYVDAAAYVTPKKAYAIAALSDPNITLALKLHYLLEMCEFQQFWQAITKQAFLQTIKGFKDSIRKFVCYVVSMTYQNIDKVLLCNFLDIYSPDLQKWIAQYNWKDLGNGSVFIANQEEIVKTKNITEKIDFENVVFTEESSSGRPPGAEGVASSQNLIWKQLKSYDSIMRQCLKSHLSIRLPGAPCNRSHIALKRKWSLHERVLWCRNER
ncbi:hypothetical protein HPB47_001038 [Ixodes persulcatus]|uniref:Uncharacterized protein n=1 Tax=Ixodes persulcatus TaxID=34615 RepID=A0AC60PS11_IXOPE|nr:hypothetical protein HPB47_001038 [Ixodes persulcatus]